MYLKPCGASFTVNGEKVGMLGVLASTRVAAVTETPPSPDLDGCIGTPACAYQHGRRPGDGVVCRQPISGVPRIRFSSRSVIGCVLASRVACFGYGHHICGPSQPAFGGDDHRCCEKNDYGAEDQESCCV
jgi:hypothetical protein